MLKKILFGGESWLSASANIGLTLLRGFAGVGLAFGHGIGKLPVSEKFVEAVGKHGFPMPTVFALGGGLYRNSVAASCLHSAFLLDFRVSLSDLQCWLGFWEFIWMTRFRNKKRRSYIYLSHCYFCSKVRAIGVSTQFLEKENSCQ